MNLYKVKDYQALSKKAASVLAAQVILKPDAVLGLATGSTPAETYAYLRKWYEDGILDFSEIKTVNLDEYKGIAKDNSQSYYTFMKEHLFDHINIKAQNTFIPDGEDTDSNSVCEKYEARIMQLGGVDLQLLGIGRNGHIGFNEPSDCFMEHCHCVSLAESTIEANKRFFDRAGDVPKQAYTMGIGTIMKAKKILLLASGKEKAKALCQALRGPVTPGLPASILRLHKDVTVIADEDAWSGMEL